MRWTTSHRASGRHSRANPESLALSPARTPRQSVLLIGDPCPGDDVIHRVAVKALVVSDERVLMLRPLGRDDLKFPGGGVEPGEDDRTALARELAEECGYALSHMGSLAVSTRERRPANDRPGAVFEMTSRYYWCEVEDLGTAPRLDDYEHALGLAPEWISVAEARDACTRALGSPDVLAWTPRELAVLRWLEHERSST